MNRNEQDNENMQEQQIELMKTKTLYKPVPKKPGMLNLYPATDDE